MTGRIPNRVGPMPAGIALAVAWWGWILLGLDPAPLPQPAVRRPPPSVAYMPVESAGMPDRPDARAIWSPVLFSLPTAVGFSREAPAGPAARPPLDPPLDPPPLLSRHVVPSAADVVPPPVPVPPQVPQRPAPPAPAEASMAAISGVIPPDSAFPVAEALRGPQPWEADAAVAFDATGLPVHAFVESADAGPRVRAEIARGVRRWRQPAGAAAGWVHVHLAHPGAIAPEAAR